MRRIKTNYPRITLQPDQAIELDHIRELAKDVFTRTQDIESNLSRYENADGLEDLSDDMQGIVKDGTRLIELALHWKKYLDRHIKKEDRRYYGDQ